jgi:hypothetical protein
MSGKAFKNGLVPKYDTPFTNTYNSISGVDIKAVLGGVTFGNLQAVSYSITREKAPIYTMGSPEPRGYSRGKRGIAGSLVFIMFDSHALLETFRALAGSGGSNSRKYQFVSDKDEPRPRLETEKYNQVSAGTVDRNRGAGVITNPITSNFEAGLADGGRGLSDLSSGWETTVPWYSDQVPPFNIVLTGVNEQGYASTMAILGVEILNEGYGISIDDIVSEQQMTYVARGIAPWTRVTSSLQKGSWRIPTTVNPYKKSSGA